MNIWFEHLLLLVLGLVGIILILFISPHVKNVSSIRIPLGPPGSIPFKHSLKTELFMKLIYVLELTGVFLLFIAVAGPFFITTETVWLNRGV